MLLILDINLTGHKKVHVEYDSWSSLRLSHRSVLSLEGQDFS